MKLLNFLMSKAGKMALSTAQAVGLSAAVGVVGIAAWQMLGSSSDVNPNTAFSSGNDDEVVFVAAGSGAGTYGGAGYGEGGEVRSGIRAKLSKDMELMQTDIQRANIPQEPEVIRQEQQVNAYKMDGASEGLGMGKNAANDLSVGQGDMSAIQQQIAALQASAAAKQKEAEASAMASAGSASAAAAAIAGKNSGKWGMADGMARAGGSNLNSTPLQAGAYGREGEGVSSSGVLGGAERTDRLAAATGAPKFEGGRDSIVNEGRRFRNSDSLEGLRKQSSDVAGNKYRSANEATRAFMAGEKLSGGINLIGENVTTGGGSSSDDFSNINTPNLGNVTAEVETYEEAREKLRREIRDFVISCNRWSNTVIFGTIFGYALRASKRNKLLRKVDSFREQWGDTNYEKDNTQGQYATIAESVIRTAYRNIGNPGGPKHHTRRFSIRYWGVPDAFSRKNWNPPTEEQKEEFKNSFEGRFFYGDALRDHYKNEVK